MLHSEEILEDIPVIIWIDGRSSTKWKQVALKERSG